MARSKPPTSPPKAPALDADVNQSSGTSSATTVTDSSLDLAPYVELVRGAVVKLSQQSPRAAAVVLDRYLPCVLPSLRREERLPQFLQTHGANRERCIKGGRYDLYCFHIQQAILALDDSLASGKYHHMLNARCLHLGGLAEKGMSLIEGTVPQGFYLTYAGDDSMFKGARNG